MILIRNFTLVTVLLLIAFPASANAYGGGDGNGGSNNASRNETINPTINANIRANTAAKAPPPMTKLSEKPAEKPSEKIMVYGDSLSAAYGLSPNQGWVSLLETKLQSRNISVINASISGETTTGGASRIATDLARHKPTLVIVALGANDGLRGLPIAEMRKNLITILNAIKKSNARAIIVGIQIPPNYGITYATNFKNTFANLASERKLALVPFLLDGIAENLDNFQADRLHPTAAVQTRILANVLPTLEREFTKTATKTSVKQVTKPVAINNTGNITNSSNTNNAKNKLSL